MFRRAKGPVLGIDILGVAHFNVNQQQHQIYPPAITTARNVIKFTRRTLRADLFPDRNAR